MLENNIEQKVEVIYYDVYVLLKYSKSEIKKERKRKEAQDRENQQLARGYLEEGGCGRVLGGWDHHHHQTGCRCCYRKIKTSRLPDTQFIKN